MQFDLNHAILGGLTGEAFTASDTRDVERPSHAEIARLAYEFYERRGPEQGSEIDDWLRAETELRRHYA
jgi:hypothetical protein